MQFLTAEGVEGREIHYRITAVYGEHSMSCSCVLEWHKRFWEDRVSLQDDSKHPPHSPDLSSCDFHISGELKKDIRGHGFVSNENVYDWVKNKLFLEWD